MILSDCYRSVWRSEVVTFVLVSQLAFAGQLKSKWLLPEICGVTSSTQK